MAKKKPPIAKHIKEGGQALAELMKEKLAAIGDDMISQVMAKAKRLTASQKLDAIKGLAPRGTQDYKASVKQALAVIALHALDQVRKEIPKAKNVRLCESLDSITLDEFDKLPPNIQKKIQSMQALLTDKQLGDLQKVVEFAYAQAEEETEDAAEIEQQLNDSVLSWLDSTSMSAGAELNSATVVNSVRSAFYADDQVSEQIEALQFVNGDPVTEICQDLAGTIFSKDDPGADQWYPPLHWNCKSYIVAITVGNLNGREIEDLAPSTKRIAETKQFHECGHDHSS